MCSWETFHGVMIAIWSLTNFGGRPKPLHVLIMITFVSILISLCSWFIASIFLYNAYLAEIYDNFAFGDCFLQNYRNYTMSYPLAEVKRSTCIHQFDVIVVPILSPNIPKEYMSEVIGTVIPYQATIIELTGDLCSLKSRLDTSWPAPPTEDGWLEGNETLQINSQVLTNGEVESRGLQKQCYFDVREAQLYIRMNNESSHFDSKLDLAMKSFALLNESLSIDEGNIITKKFKTIEAFARKVSCRIYSFVSPLSINKSSEFSLLNSSLQSSLFPFLRIHSNFNNGNKFTNHNLHSHLSPPLGSTSLLSLNSHIHNDISSLPNHQTSFHSPFFFSKETGNISLMSSSDETGELNDRHSSIMLEPPTQTLVTDIFLLILLFLIPSIIIIPTIIWLVGWLFISITKSCRQPRIEVGPLELVEE